LDKNLVLELNHLQFFLPKTNFQPLYCWNLIPLKTNIKLISSPIKSAYNDGQARRQAAQRRWSVIRLVKSCDPEAEEVARKEKLQVNLKCLLIV
jgi:hypothetical protein